MKSKRAVLADYHTKLHQAVELKDDGIEVVSYNLTGSRIAEGRSVIPIDEYMETLRNGIKSMIAGADHKEYEF